MKFGKFISLEGIDGAGKSSHIHFIAEYLTKHEQEVVITREPGGTHLGEKIRELLLHSKSMQPITELLLMFASRQELISSVILPNLKLGKWVISDRFIDSSIAYQAFGRKIGVEQVETLISLLSPLVKPDLTFVFDAPLAIARERNSQADRIEEETNQFFLDVQNAYLTIAEMEPKRVKLINTDCPMVDIEHKLSLHLEMLL